MKCTIAEHKKNIEQIERWIETDRQILTRRLEKQESDLREYIGEQDMKSIRGIKWIHCKTCKHRTKWKWCTILKYKVTNGYWCERWKEK